MNEAMTFLSSPQLADIVSYFLIVVGYVWMIFTRMFVKKDNIFTRKKFSLKFDELATTKEKLRKQQELLENERQAYKVKMAAWQKEKKELLQVQKRQAEAIVLIAGNVPELVKRGISNDIAITLLPNNNLDVGGEENDR